jgi:hypothetical protein
MRSQDTLTQFDATDTLPVDQTLYDPVFTGLVAHRRGSASFCDNEYIYEDECEPSNRELQEC